MKDQKTCWQEMSKNYEHKRWWKNIWLLRNDLEKTQCLLQKFKTHSWTCQRFMSRKATWVAASELELFWFVMQNQDVMQLIKERWYEIHYSFNCLTYFDLKEMSFVLTLSSIRRNHLRIFITKSHQESKRRQLITLLQSWYFTFLTVSLPLEFLIEEFASLDNNIFVISKHSVATTENNDVSNSKNLFCS